MFVSILWIVLRKHEIAKCSLGYPGIYNTRNRSVVITFRVVFSRWSTLSNLRLSLTVERPAVTPHSLLKFTKISAWVAVEDKYCFWTGLEIMLLYSLDKKWVWYDRISVQYLHKNGEWLDCNLWEWPHLTLVYVSPTTTTKAYWILFYSRVTCMLRSDRRLIVWLLIYFAVTIQWRML